MSALLKVEALRKHFGNLRAVDGADFTVEAGQFTAVIGPNGAGKTTLFNLVTGALRPDGGRVWLAGKDITKASPEAIVKAGLARTFQITSIFPELTVLKNVMLAALAQQRRAHAFWKPYASERAARDRAYQLLERIGLRQVAHRPSGTLSHADQQLVEVAMALATEPRLLLLDEPTAGMAPGETQQVVSVLREVAQREQVTMVLIEHDMDVVFSVAERILVLHQGRVIADGPPRAIRENPTVREVYLGGSFAG